jgi:hypothetical protein
VGGYQHFAEQTVSIYGVTTRRPTLSSVAYLPTPVPDQDMWHPRQANNLAPVQTDILQKFQHSFSGGGEKQIFY